jgi:surfeit locus 1 family protein
VIGGDADGVARPASVAKLAVFALLAFAAIAGLSTLGVWQFQRLAWKQDLIRRVDARIHAEPVAAPGPADWPSMDPANSEYRKVHVQGQFLHDRETLVQAVSIRGAGFWVITPLRPSENYTVLINRGFIPAAIADDHSSRSFDGTVAVTGLLRLSEPGGGFLRSNDPSSDRWYSRDVTAIAAARGIVEAAPYFIDASADEPVSPGAPAGGLTVVHFSNNHLQYALTWFALALMTAGGTWLVFRREWRLRKSMTS